MLQLKWQQYLKNIGFKKTVEVRIDKYFAISGEVYCAQGYHSYKIQPSYFSPTINCFRTTISAFIHQ